MSGSFPVRGPRGTSSLLLNRPCLWASASEALGFAVAEFRYHEPGSSPRGFDFGGILDHRYPHARRKFCSSALSHGEDIAVVLGNMSALPPFKSKYWTTTDAPHMVSIDVDEVSYLNK